MSTAIDACKLKPGDLITIQSKKSNENHDGCVFKVRSKVAASGWLGVEVVSIDEKIVKRGEKGLKPSGVFENDYSFFVTTSKTKVGMQYISSFSKCMRALYFKPRIRQMVVAAGRTRKPR